ncbi:hypothetical protein CCP1ISM_1570001 [Azospirillaceae bacterium]
MMHMGDSPLRFGMNAKTLTEGKANCKAIG